MGWHFRPGQYQLTENRIKMNTRIIHHCDMFDRVIIFGRDDAGDFPAGSAGATRFANLSGISQQLTAAGARQRGDHGGGAERADHDLDVDLQNIARTARAIAQDEPGFNDNFPPPEHYNPHEVLATAEKYLSEPAAQEGDDDAAKAAKAALAAKFTAHDLPATFVADLQAAVDDIETAQGAHESSRERGAGSTTAIAALVRAGMKEVNYLDAIMNNKHRGNAEKLRAWQAASHIERDAVHPNPAPAPTPAPTKA
jgi:hypothetical protein